MRFFGGVLGADSVGGAFGAGAAGAGSVWSAAALGGWVSALGQRVIRVLIKVASGMAKNTPQKPHRPPKIMIAAKIEKASRLIALAKSIGVRMLLSKSWITV